MKPPKSLMAFVFAMLLAAPVLGAPSQWTSFQVAGRPYFAHADSRADFNKDPKAAASLDLYDSPSDQTPAAALTRDAKGMLMVKRNGQPNGVMPSKEEVARIPTTPILPPSKPAAPKLAQTKSTNADPDIAAILTAVGNVGKPDDLAATLAALKAGDPATFALLKSGAASGDPGKVAAVGNLLTTALQAKNTEDAVLFLRSAGPGALGESVDADPTAVGRHGAPGVNGKPVEGETSAMAVNPIPKAVVTGEPGQARIDAIDAIVEFMVDPAAGYIDPGVRAAKGDAAKGQKTQLDGMVAGMRAMLTTKMQNGDEANGIGVLYTALLAGKSAPDWVSDEQKAAVTDFLKAIVNVRAIFDGAMQPWTPKGAKPTDDCKSAGPWKGGSAGAGETSGGNTTVDQWEAAFLVCAERQAGEALNKSKIPKGTAERIAGVLGSGFTPPPGGVHVPNPNEPKTGINLNFTAAGFTTEELYRKGAIVHKMQMTLPDGREVEVQVALKLFYRQEGTQMIPELGIYDVTNDGTNGGTTHVYGQNVDLTQIAGDAHDLRLQTNPDSYYDKDKYPIKYQISRDPDTGDITFGVTNGAEIGKPGDQRTVITQKDLYAAFQGEVEQSGHTVEVNGHRFQVMGQGGKAAQLLFFEANGTDLSKGGDKLAPSLISGPLNGVNLNPDTNFPTEKLTTGDKDGYHSLGYVGYNAADPTKKQYYAMKWSDGKGYYELVPTDHEINDAPAPAPPPADANNNNNKPQDPANPTPPVDPANPTTPTTPTTGDPSTVGRGNPNPTNAAPEACVEGIPWGPTPLKLQASNKAWTYWIDKSGNSVECFYRNRYVGGNLLSELEETADDIVVTKVSLDGTFPEATRVESKMIGVNGAITVQGRATTVKTIGVYRIKKAGMGPIAEMKSYTAESYDKLSWLMESYTPKAVGVRFPTQFTLYLEADQANRIKAVVDKLGGLDANMSSVFGAPINAGNRAALADYLARVPVELKMSGRYFAEINVNIDDGAKQGATVVTLRNEKGSALDTQRWCVPEGQLDPKGHLEDRSKKEKCDQRPN